MTDSNNIQDIISIIKENNTIDVYLPDSKETIKTKRYDLSSINKLTSLIGQNDINKLVLQYNDFLFDLIKERTNKNLPYLDYITLLIALRKEENNIFKDINLTDIIANLNINNINYKKSIVVEERGIKYEVNFGLPTINKSKEILKQSLEDASVYLLYNNIFRFITDIKITSNDKEIIVNKQSELKELYNAISYRVLNEFGKNTSLIEKELYNLFKVNIETDTSFLYTI